MANNTVSSTANQAELKEESINFQQIIGICIVILQKHWMWFLTSVVLFVVLAFVYSRTQPQVYQRTAVLEIEDNNGSGSMGRAGSGANMLLELNGVSVGNSLQDETFILQSYRLMERVVSRLGLDVSYDTKDGLRPISLFSIRPFNVVFQAPFSKALAFDVKILDENSFELKNLQFEDFDSEFNYKGTFGRPFSTPVGKIVLNKNSQYISEFVGKKISITRISVKDAAKIYVKRISATPVDKQSSLIQLVCQDVNKKRAEVLLSTLLDVYREDIIESKNRVAENTSKFIEERIGLIEQDLIKVEGSLARFKEKYNIVDFQKSADAFLQQQGTARNLALDYETQLSVARYLESYLHSKSKDDEFIPMLDLGDAGIQQEISAYNDILIEKKNLEQNSTNSPVIRDMNEALKAKRASILAGVRSYVNSVSLKAQKARTNENVLNSAMSEVPQKERQANDIQRQQILKENLYNYLLNKREEVALQLAINEANIRVVEPPYGNKRPIAPRTMIFVLVGFVIGLALPSAYFGMLYSMDTALRSRKEVEDAMSLPIVGEIPRWEMSERSMRDGIKNLIATDQNNNSVAEAFRLLRYNLNFMVDKKDSKHVIMLTSSSPSQGKTFVSRNLSHILAQARKRVVLIDADIRKGTQSSLLGHGQGLTAYLNNDTDSYEDLLIRDKTDFDFIPSGIIPPNPAELLMNSRLEELIGKLKEVYDYIVIDTTPAFQVADAAIVSRVADVTLFVMRIGVEDKRIMPEVEKLQTSGKIKNMCIVLNGCRMHNGYGYGYGYGYGRQSQKK